MLKLVVPKSEMFDESTNAFIEIPGYELQLEHSLISVSKWESKWNIPFLSKKDKTREQAIDYIRCMNMTQHCDHINFARIPNAQLDLVTAYIHSPMSATTFAKSGDKITNREVVTSELIYYWMVAFNIPKDCERWHLNRLLNLINICSIKNQPAKKMSQKEIIARNRTLNAERRAALKTKG